MTAYQSWVLEIAWDSSGTPFVDMTSRVQGSVVIVHGRTEELGDIQPGTMTVVLDDVDKTLTPGNSTSSLYPDVELGRIGRLVETVGGNSYTRFYGFLTDIAPGSWVDSGDSVVTLTFSDLLDRLQRAPKFVSTLTAQILDAGGDNLIGLYPMNEGGPPITDVTQRGILPATLDETPGSPASIGTPDDPHDLLTYQGATELPGDDLPTLLYDPIFGTTAAADRYVHKSTYHVGAGSSWSVSAGQVLTVAAWVNPSLVSTEFWRVVTIAGATDSVTIAHNGDGGTPPSVWVGEVNGSGGAGLDSASTGEPPAEHPVLIALQVDWDADTAVLWIHDAEPISATLTGSFSALGSFTAILIGTDAPAAIGYVQIYRGTASAYTRAMHLEQIAQAYNGLERQYTGERIATLASYAGIDPGDTDLDTGTTQMQEARLAGLTPYDAMVEAARTESGDLFAAGDGTLTFRARTRRYNQTATTLQKSWLDDGLQPRVDGPIINEFTATVRDGGRSRATAATSIAAKGVFSGEIELSTMQPSEAVDAAQYRVDNYADQRTRVPALPIDLLHQGNSVKDTVLGLEIGDRADISGMPAAYPIGAEKLVIEGWTEHIGIAERRIVFVTSPVLGSPVGTAATYFRLDDATLGELDAGNPLAY